MAKETGKYAVAGSNYPSGPCDYPKQCICGRVITSDSECKDGCDDVSCDVCEYCSNAVCPDCGAHMCCGGCV